MASTTAFVAAAAGERPVTAAVRIQDTPSLGHKHRMHRLRACYWSVLVQARQQHCPALLLPEAWLPVCWPHGVVAAAGVVAVAVALVFAVALPRPLRGTLGFLGRHSI